MIIKREIKPRQLASIVDTVLKMKPKNRSLVLKYFNFKVDSAEAKFTTDIGIVTINRYFTRAGACVTGINTNLAQSEISVYFSVGV